MPPRQAPRKASPARPPGRDDGKRRLLTVPLSTFLKGRSYASHVRYVFGPFQTKIAASRQRGRPAERNSPLRRLRLETLEDRLVLSGSPVIVTSSADSGPGSLRAAITSAVSGETIEFANSVHSIALTSGDLPISVNLKIQGPGADKLTISGDNANLAMLAASLISAGRSP